MAIFNSYVSSPEGIFRIKATTTTVLTPQVWTSPAIAQRERNATLAPLPIRRWNGTGTRSGRKMSASLVVDGDFMWFLCDFYVIYPTIMGSIHQQL